MKKYNFSSQLASLGISLILFCLIAGWSSCSSDDDTGNGSIIPSETLPAGTYDILRHQSMGVCVNDELDDLNPCKIVEVTTEYCVGGTVDVVLNEMDMNGLVITAETPFGQFNFQVGSITSAFDQSGRGPLNELIVYDLGNDKYTIEAADKPDCFAVMTINRQ